MAAVTVVAVGDVVPADLVDPVAPVTAAVVMAVAGIAARIFAKAIST